MYSTTDTVGLISVLVWGSFNIKLALGTNASNSISFDYPGTQHVCEGDSAYTAMTLGISQDVSPKDIKIMVEGGQFSEGANVRGQFHLGDDRINRWTNELSFRGNQLTYKIWNSKTKYRDEFYSYLEINSGGEKIESEYFRWFYVENCTSQTKPANCTPGTPQPSQADIMEQLKQMAAVQNATQSVVVKLYEHNTELKEELRQTNGHLNSTKSAMVELHNQYADLNGRLNSIKSEMVEQHNQYADLNGRLNSTKSAMVELHNQYANLNGHLNSIKSEMVEQHKQNAYQHKVLVRCIITLIIVMLSNFAPLLRMLHQYLKDKFPRYFSGNSSSPADGHPLSNISGGAEGRSSDQEAPQPAGSLHSLLSPEEEQNDDAV